jgi:hypothetical protein
MYKHDNSQRLRRLLDASVIKRRNKQNALTFFSQFCSFAFEISVISVIFIAIWMGTSQNLLYLSLSVLKKISISGTAMVEVFTSSHLRKNLFRPFER